MSDRNKATVRRYFAEVVDGRSVAALDELFASDCIVHRPEIATPLVGLAQFRQALGRLLDTYSEIKTTMHDIFAAEDKVACRLTHRAVNRGEWRSRLGRHAVAGKPVDWSAMAIFRFRDGKIAEEWVCRDELGMLLKLGVLTAAEH
jgi:ketosteroid isomerase-like protein